MKISWGYKITFLYCSFAGMIIFMVYMSMQQSIELVSDNYYEKTLHYEEQIERMKNSNLPQNKIRFTQDKEKFEITFPEQKYVSGEVKFFKPDNSRLDFAIHIDKKNKLSYDTSKLAKGKWQLQINWLVDNISVYNEKTLIIN